MSTNERLQNNAPTNSQQINARNNASFDGSPRRRRPGGWDNDPGEPASDGPKQLWRTRRTITNTLADIAAGRSSGDYPAIDAIIGPGRSTSSPEPRIARPRRSSPGRRPRPWQQSTRQSIAFSSGLKLITDIYPQLHESVAINSHEITNMKADITALTVVMATKEEVKTIDRRINSIHKRLDRDILPAIEHIRKSEGIKDSLLVLGLVASLLANAIMLWDQFLRHQ